MTPEMSLIDLIHAQDRALRVEPRTQSEAVDLRDEADLLRLEAARWLRDLAADD